MIKSNKMPYKNGKKTNALKHRVLIFKAILNPWSPANQMKMIMEDSFQKIKIIIITTFLDNEVWIKKFYHKTI